MDGVLNILRGIIDIIYPQRLTCLFCGCQLSRVGDLQLCRNCMTTLPYITGEMCVKCGRPVDGGYGDRECNNCKDTVRHFDEGASVFEFSGIIQAALYKLKFDGDDDIAQPIGRFMAGKLQQKDWGIDVIVPVPLHENRLRERGFNQSYLLAHEIGRECSIDVGDDALVRQKNTESQVTLSRLQRIHNVRGAFAVSERNALSGRKVLIIDDIMTTGATLNECSRIAREAGAKEVYCLTAACPQFISH